MSVSRLSKSAVHHSRCLRAACFVFQSDCWTRAVHILGILILLVSSACSKSERPVSEEPSNEPAAEEAVIEAVSPEVPSIVAEGKTKETVSDWSSVIKKELKALAELIADGSKATRSVHALGGVVRAFDPTDLETREIHRGPTVAVSESLSADPGQTIETSSAAFVENLRKALWPEQDVRERIVRFKLFAIDRDGVNLTTRQRMTSQALVDGVQVQTLSVVDASWILPSEGAAEKWPQLRAWTMPKLVRSSTLVDASRVGFEDVAERVLGENLAWNEQIQFGMNTWRRHIERSLNPDFLGYHGLAVRDVTGDGLEDLYVCQPGGLPNLLFEQQADGSMVDISATAGVDWLDNSTGALLVDLDNDGDADLALATRTAFLVMENDGKGRFSLVRRISELGMGYSVSAVDYDRDADLDLFVLRYTADGKVGDFPTPHPFHSARNGGENVLLRNEGAFKFQNVTEDVGLGLENFRFSFAASWEDYDNDGDMDVYIANDFGPNQLFRNDGARFVDQSVESGTQDWGFGMSATWADYNRDGTMDLYVSSMFSGAGNQVVAQSDFNANMPEETRDKYLKMVRGNTLLKNDGSGTFTDVTQPMAEGFGRWAWGTKFADFDNDGWEDLYVANGYISQPDTDDL